MEGRYTVKQKDILLNSEKDKITLWCFGDIHRFTKSCDEDRWKWFLERAKSSHNEFSYYVGLGDYMDFASYSERKGIHATAHEQTIQDLGELIKKRNRVFSREMNFMKPNILGLIEGNHNWVFENGQTSTEDLADRLGTESLGHLCHYTLKVRWKTRGPAQTNIYIILSHGKAGGKTAGASVNQVDDIRDIFPLGDIYCISEDTEILTLNGWKGINDININDPVYSWNDKTNKIEIDNAEMVVSYPYKGAMINIKNTTTDQLLIPEHRVYYKHNKDYLVNTADHLYNINAQIKLPMSADFGDGVKLTDDEIALAGWILAEGHFKGNKNDWGSGILIYQKSISKTNDIKDLLNRLNYVYSYKERSDKMNIFYIKRQSSIYIKENLIDNKNSIPKWVFQTDNRQFKIFWDAFIKGDGHKANDKCGTAYSANKELMDELQAALLMHGFRSGLRYKKGGFKNGGWRLTYCNNYTTELNTKLKIKKVEYEGMVWCISTKNKTFIARRNGNAFITGNCYGHDHQRWARPVSVLIPTSDNAGTVFMKQKRQFLSRAGSFKKAFCEGQSGYEVQRLLRPADLGPLQFDISFHRDKKFGDRIVTDIMAIV